MILRKSSSAQLTVLIMWLLLLSWVRSAQILWIWGKSGQSCIDTCTEALNLVTYTPISNSRCYESLWTSVTTIAEFKTKKTSSQNWNGKVGKNPTCTTLLAPQRSFYPGYDGSGNCYVGNGTTSSCGSSSAGFLRICPCDSSTDSPSYFPTPVPTPKPSAIPTLVPTGFPSPAPSAFSISGILQDLFSSGSSGFGTSYGADVGVGGVVDDVLVTSNPMGFVAALAIPRSSTGGSLYVLDSVYNKIWLISIGTSSSSVTFSTINIGTSTFSTPLGMTVDISGNIYVADSNNHQIKKVVHPFTGSVINIAGTAGSYGSTGDGSSATSARLNYPKGMAVDSSANVYIADWKNFVIRYVNSRTGIITTFAGNRVGASTGDLGPATSASVYPSDVAIDETRGWLYITQQDANNVRQVNLTSRHITTFVGSRAGLAGSTGDTGLVGLARLTQPAKTTVDAAGNLFIADTGNNECRIVQYGTQASNIYLLFGSLTSTNSGEATSSHPFPLPCTRISSTHRPLYTSLTTLSPLLSSTIFGWVHLCTQSTHLLTLPFNTQTALTYFQHSSQSSTTLRMDTSMRRATTQSSAWPSPNTRPHPPWPPPDVLALLRPFLYTINTLAPLRSLYSSHTVDTHTLLSIRYKAITYQCMKYT